MKIVYDNGEANINRIPMAYACCDKCENPNRFAIGFINEPLVNPWDEQEHKYCEKCGAFMDWKTVNIESQYEIFLAEHDKQIRAEVIEEVIKLLNSIEYSTYNDDTRRIEHHIKAQLTEQLERLKEKNK